MARVVFLGAPGAGKGTQAKRAAQMLGIPHISTGDMLRTEMESGSEFGKSIKATVESGGLVSDETMLGVVEVRLGKPDCTGGFILDGFPRTVDQASGLAALLGRKGIGLNAVVFLDVPENELVSRLRARASVESRADDSEESQRQRLKVYNDLTLPLVAYYESAGLLRRVNGLGSVEEIETRVLEVIKGTL